MLLPDFQIKEYLDKGDLVIDPFEDWMLQPASVDVHLGAEFMIYKDSDWPIDPYKGVGPSELEMLSGEDEYPLYPGEAVLATTKQQVELPTNIKATVEGKSTLGRYFIEVHSTAGFIDPGFKGQVTLEIKNCNKRTFMLIPGMPIGQLSFILLTAPAQKPYGTWELGSKYQEQKGVTPPRPLRRPVWSKTH